MRNHDQQQSKVQTLSKLLNLLEAAKLRKVGYQKWNRAAIWFSTYEQQHKIIIIDKAIARIENRIREVCFSLLINL